MDYGRRCDDLADLGPVAPRRTSVGVRTLSQRLLAAAHYACDVGEFGLARVLLTLTEEMLVKRRELQGSSRRRVLEDVVKAYERLWRLSRLWPETLPPSGAFESVRGLLRSGD